MSDSITRRQLIKDILTKAPAVSLPIRTIFQMFTHREATGGLVMILLAIVALFWANSRWSDLYFDLWQMPVILGIGDWLVSKPLLKWINDGLMAIFFLVVGLEIKREVLAGELAAPGKAVLPVMAALGGMIVPGVLYTLFNFGSAGSGGWGIPVATDIAFTLGIIALLGRRVLPSLKVFLTALAIADDIGAALVIALFYSEHLALVHLGIAALVFSTLMILNWRRVHQPIPYALLGIGLWVALLNSGLHATIAGILVAITIPATTHVDVDAYLVEGRDLLDTYEEAGLPGHDVLASERRQLVAQAMDRASERMETPLQRLEHALHPWVSYVVVPLFVLANAGVAINVDALTIWSYPVTLGVLAGLMLGKPLGISLFSWLAVRAGIAELPSGVSWRQLVASGFLAGIGFTMSLFIAGLAFESSDLLSQAKIGILTASLLAGIAGWLLLRLSPPVELSQQPWRGETVGVSTN